MKNEQENELKNAEANAGGTAAQEDIQPAPAPLSPEQIEELKSRAAKAEENWDRLLRVTADFDNYKKRATREKQDAIKYANESLLQKLIPVMDNFEMALAAPSSAENAQSLQTGIVMIAQQLKSVLAEAGLEEIETLGKPFDPNFQEAVSQQETRDAREGDVIQQLRKGYKMRDRLVRPASVVVAKKPTK